MPKQNKDVSHVKIKSKFNVLGMLLFGCCLKWSAYGNASKLKRGFVESFSAN